MSAVSAGSPTRITCSRSGSWDRIGSTLRTYAARVVTSTRAREIASRVRTGSGPNAAKSGEYTLPCFSVPSAVTYSSGMRLASVHTMSPRATPSVSRMFANRLVDASRSAYDRSLSPPPLDRKR